MTWRCVRKGSTARTLRAVLAACVHSCPACVPVCSIAFPRQVMDVLCDAMVRPKYSHGVLVDGFPRTSVQADVIRLLYDRVVAQAVDFGLPRPRFRVVVLFIDEPTSIRCGDSAAVSPLCLSLTHTHPHPSLFSCPGVSCCVASVLRSTMPRWRQRELVRRLRSGKPTSAWLQQGCATRRLWSRH